MRLKRRKLMRALLLATVALAVVATGAHQCFAETPAVSASESETGARELISSIDVDVGGTPATSRLQWWATNVNMPILPMPHWVSFDLDTVLVDTLRHSPRIQSVSSRTSIAFEKVVQQDAAFDSSMLFEARGGRTNDPVGNTLTTGGPRRLNEESLLARAGVQKTTRSGTVLDLSQELGTLDSNSLFFDPTNQGNSRLSLSLTRPLMARSGKVFTERLLTQAQIDASVSWQDMRTDIEKRVAEVMVGYWQLYELRCHLIQQRELLERGRGIETIIKGRSEFDSSQIELAKVQARISRSVDQVLVAEANVRRAQTNLAMLVGADELVDSESRLEMIPVDPPIARPFNYTLRDALLRGIENRPEIRAATHQLESAGLSIQITRNQLKPELNAVVDAYLAGLNGRNAFLRSFGDQFSDGGPGISAALQYEMPRGRRFAKSRHREAQYLFRQKSEELREAMQIARTEIETALIGVETAIAQQQSKYEIVTATVQEEAIITERWRMMGGNGNRAGVVLENLLDAQQRRTEAERGWVTTQIQYLTSLVQLQRAMGTLLIHENIATVRGQCQTQIHTFRESTTFDEPLIYDKVVPGSGTTSQSVREAKRAFTRGSTEFRERQQAPREMNPLINREEVGSSRLKLAEPLRFEPTSDVESPTGRLEMLETETFDSTTNPTRGQ